MYIVAVPSIGVTELVVECVDREHRLSEWKGESCWETRRSEVPLYMSSFRVSGRIGILVSSKALQINLNVVFLAGGRNEALWIPNHPERKMTKKFNIRRPPPGHCKISGDPPASGRRVCYTLQVCGE